MKKTALLFITLLALCASFLCAAELPTIDQVLSIPGLTGRIQVSDDLSMYSWENQGDLNGIGTKMIVLERRAADKAFTELDSGYPDSMIEGFPEDFGGVDVGDAELYVRNDLMQLLPEAYRATSLAEAGLLIMAENVYFWDSTIRVTDYADSSAGELPEDASLDELAAFLASYKPEIESIKYYPVFASATLVNLYNTATGTAYLYDYTYTDGKLFSQNPEAYYKWEAVETLGEVFSKVAFGALNQKKLAHFPAAPGPKELVSLVSELEIVPGTRLDAWQNLLTQGQYAPALASIADTYWETASELSMLDPSDEHRAVYDRIIGARDADMLALFVGYCNYTGFDRSIGDIELTKDYLAPYEEQWAEDALRELTGIFAGY